MKCINHIYKSGKLYNMWQLTHQWLVHKTSNGSPQKHTISQYHNWRANTRSGLTHLADKKLEEWVNRLILLDVANSLVIQTELTDSIVLINGLALVNELQCTLTNALLVYTMKQ